MAKKLIAEGSGLMHRKRVGPVSFLLVMFIAALIGMPTTPTLMPDVVGLSAEVAQIEAQRYVSNAVLTADNNVSLEYEALSDWVVYEQRPNVGEEITRDTAVILLVKLSDDAIARRTEEARIIAAQAEAERLAAVEAEQKRIEAEALAEAEAEAKAAQLAAAQAEQERIEAERARMEREAAQQAESDRQAAAVAPPTTTDTPDESIPARFRNCTHVWEVLGRPILRGERGFHDALDRDGDGVGCEQRPRS